MDSKFKKIIRNVYLYTFSAVGLIFMIVGAAILVNVVLKTYVFPLEHYSEYYYSRCGDYIYMDNSKEDFDMETCEANEADDRATEDSDARKRDMAVGFSNLMVGLPLWLYHWKTIQRRKEKEE